MRLVVGLVCCYVLLLAVKVYCTLLLFVVACYGSSFSVAAARFCCQLFV